jgi:hypothetical protein
MAVTARLNVNVFDSTRKPVRSDLELRFTIRDGHQHQQSLTLHGPSIPFDVEFFDDLGDRYAVLVSAAKHVQAEFFPVVVSRTVPRVLDLMLMPKKNRFDFTNATWAKLKNNQSIMHAVLAQGLTDTQAKARYEQFMADSPGSLAAFFNIMTALRDIHLPSGVALEYFKGMSWDEKKMGQDRFFAFADAALVDQVVLAAHQGAFEPQGGLDINHPGATRSYKQKQFGEANVQLSFHENDRKKIPEGDGGVDCVKVELDMDYFQDPLAHLFLEVLPNKVSKGKTDPRKIYMLRWIAGRHAGVPEFDPPYTIEAA